MVLVVKYVKPDGTKVWGSTPSQHQIVSSKRVQKYDSSGNKISDNQRKRVVDYYGNVNWVMPDKVRDILNYRPTIKQITAEKTKSLKSKEAKTSVLPTETQARNAEVKMSKSLKSSGITGSWTTRNWYQKLDAKLGGVLPFGGTSAYSTADTNFFKGFLPGGIARTDYVSQYTIPALDQKTEVQQQYQEAKDRLESVEQMGKLQDKDTDFSYKLAKMQQELSFKQAQEALKQELDASNQSWYEVFNKQERALEQARANIGREKEARLIEQSALALRETQDYSSLDRVNRSLKETSQPPSSGFGSGFLSGAGTSTALLLGIGALVFLKK